MKWIALKTYLLSLIEQETEKVIDRYINLIKDIKRTNRIGIIREFDELRQSIALRIQEIDNFYLHNINDIRASSFIKVRKRLNKLLEFDVNNVNKLEKVSEVMANANSSYANNDKLDDNNRSQIKLAQTSYYKNFEKSNRNNTHSNISEKNKMNSTTNLSLKKEMSFINNNDTSFKQRSLSTKRPNKFEPLKKYSDINPVKENNNYKDWKEIVFRIKLSEAEYKLLLKEKSKAVKL